MVMKEKKYPKLADNIAQLLSELNIKAPELASRIDVKRRTVYSWINGEREPEDINVLIKLANLSKKSLYEFTGAEAFKLIEDKMNASGQLNDSVLPPEIKEILDKYRELPEDKKKEFLNFITTFFMAHLNNK